VRLFNELLSDRFILQIPEAGLNFVARLRCDADFARVARVRAEIGIKPSPLSFYCMQAKLKPAFVFGFAAWTPAQIRESLLRLASAFK
jgi:DNA-binding transcriptional MocR family regulator